MAIFQQKITDHLESTLINYLSILGEMLLMDEAQTTLVSTSFYLSTLLQFIHIPNLIIINTTVALFNRICEYNQQATDILSQCILEENNITNVNNTELSLSILICLLDEGIDISIKMTILKFLAILIYSTKSLSLRVKVLSSIIIYA